MLKGTFCIITISDQQKVGHIIQASLGYLANFRALHFANDNILRSTVNYFCNLVLLNHVKLGLA